MKLFYQKGKAYLFSTLLLLMVCMTAMSQTTLTTNFTNNNGFSLVTLNFTNNNPGAVLITDIASVCGASGSMQVAAYYKASAIAGAPGAISPANGWNQFGSATITAIANTTTTTAQPFMSGLSLVVPAGATYGIAVEAASLRYSTVAAGTYTTTGGGCVITSGSNISYAGDVAPNAPTFTPRGFIGSITFTDAAPCSGTPAPGNTLSTANPVCPGINFTLSKQNATAGSGVTNQWQSSPDGTTWTNIAAATGTTYSTSIATATWFRCLVTCSGNTTPTTPLQVTINPPSSCYCTPPATNCSLDDEILNVTAAGINNSSSGCSGAGYSNYTTSVAAGTVEAGLNMPTSVRVGPGGTEYVGVWIDYNRNGAFDASEFTALGSGNGVTINGFVQVPATATPGLTRMRVRVRFNTALTGGDACLGYTYGETEDYSINITPCIVGTISTQPANGSVMCGGTKTFTVAAAGTGLTYQWQSRVNATSPWTIVNNGGIYSGATTATLTLTGVSSALNGNQFQVAVGGSCTPLFLSSIATLTVTPLVATVNPLPVNRCSGDAASPISITNASGATTTVSFPSAAALNIPIPDDGTVTGINNTINVTTVPSGVSVTGLSVKVNITHSWVGDLILVLKAPNGRIINLAAALGTTGGAAASTGFTNTVISSDGINALVSGANPYTATFKADLQTTNIPSLPPYSNVAPGPTGFLPDASNWAPLLSSNPNGNWTLALYDYYEDDLLTNRLVNWTMNITYGAPATGIFSPNTDLYTDAAATIPYTGTPINTVYAMPAATTNYSVVVTTPTCVSGALTIPVNVGFPIGTVTAPTDKSVCIGGTTSFTVSALPAGNALAYQWQVSPDGGATWNNVSNGGVYSGATTGTLTLTNVPDTYTGNKYRATLTVAACTSSVISGAATLTVNPLPVVVINAAPYTKLHPGLTTTITAAVSPNAAATYQWYKNGVLIPGATASRIVVDVDNLGDYSVTVDDVNGCNSSSSSLTISDAANDILFIYPSPNTGQFQVRYYNTPGNNVNVRTLTIFDSKGSRVYSKTYDISLPYTKMDVDMTNFSKGIYHVELGDRNGKRIKTGSVLIR